MGYVLISLGKVWIGLDRYGTCLHTLEKFGIGFMCPDWLIVTWLVLEMLGISRIGWMCLSTFDYIWSISPRMYFNVFRMLGILF